MQNDNRNEQVTKRKRDESGLCVGINYSFKEDGSIDWRKMVKPEFIYPNNQYFTDKKKSVPPSAEGLEDHECLVSLAGLKELLSLRGYENVDFQVLSDNNATVTIKCTIIFSPNYETDGKSCVRSDIATAGVFNVHQNFQHYYHTIAANRAMARAIRSFLNIHIVANEEIGDTSSEAASQKVENVTTPSSLVLGEISKKGLNEKDVKEICEKNGLDVDWETFEDIKSKSGSFFRKLLPKIREKV